jgi:hypothetical protein
MNLFKLPLLLVVSLATTVAGCSDKEKEMLKRTNDGTETFKYIPPPPAAPKEQKPSEASVPSGPLKPARSQSSSPDSADGGRRPDDSSNKFKYQPDPRLVRQMSK